MKTMERWHKSFRAKVWPVPFAEFHRAASLYRLRCPHGAYDAIARAAIAHIISSNRSRRQRELQQRWQ